MVETVVVDVVITVLIGVVVVTVLVSVGPGFESVTVRVVE
jgi:hypothetical protein